MAKEGIVFARISSASSWTVPSTMTWFTGVYPSEHRMTNKFIEFTHQVQRPAKLKDLSPELVTLAQVMKRNGYATAGFTGNAGVSGGFGYDQGFDVYIHEREVFGGFDQSLPKAMEWLTANKDRKFFLFLHGYDCHGQNVPAGGFDYRFVDKHYDKRFTGSIQEQEVLREEGLDKGQLNLRDADTRFWRAIYDEKIQRADAKFGAFLREFKNLGIMDNTLFVLVSDHGTEIHEHGRFDHGFTLYEEQIHVPLVIKLPGRAVHRMIRERVSSIDLMPTILDLTDVRVPVDVQRQMRGTSLRSVMDGAPAGRDVFSETDYRAFTYKRSVTTPDGWKLIYTLECKSRELFHLETDAIEAHDLAKSDPRRADELERRLFDYFRSIGHDLTRRTWDIGLNPVYPMQGKNLRK